MAPSKLRQTLLSFQPCSSIGILPDKESSLTKPVDSSYTPSPPLILPSEVWDQILRPLGTIALKKFRLVCREWSIIGAPWLFDTVYLDCYEKSWAGLISLSRSSHAAMVRSVEWNSLVFYNDCDDPTIWSATYHNLLGGLTHRDTIRFFNIYYQVYRAHTTLFRSTSLDAAAEALRSLTNCHNAIVSDDYDLTSTCDNTLTAAIADLPNVLNRPATWGLRPPCLRGEDSARIDTESDILGNVTDIFKVLSQCSNVKSMTLVLWENHLNKPVERGSWQFGLSNHINSLQNSHLTSLDCRLKYPDRLLKTYWGYYGIDNREVTFNHFKHFSRLKDLRVEGLLSQPTGLIFTSNHRREVDSADSDASSNVGGDDSTSSHESDESDDDDPFVDKRPDGFTEAMFRCLCIPLQLTFSHFPGLRTLTLSDLSLSANSALCFLSSQQQLPKSPFSLHFQGTIILYDLIPKVFFECLKQLNVQIYYTPRSTYYYSHPPLSNDLREWGPNLTCYTKKEDRAVLHEGAYESIPNRHYPGQAEIPIPQQMPPCPSIERQKPTPNALTIVDRPSCYQHSTAHLTSILLSRPSTVQIYRIRKQGHQTIWEWVLGTDAFDSITKRQPRKDTHILHSLLVEEDPGWYGPYTYDDEEEGRIRDALAWGSQFELAARESRYMQDMLQQYERELLGTDLLDLHRHQVDLAVEILQLWEASRTPDSEEYVLHQYETELLGLDLFTRELKEANKRDLIRYRPVETYPWRKGR